MYILYTEYGNSENTLLNKNKNTKRVCIVTRDTPAT